MPPRNAEQKDRSIRIEKDLVDPRIFDFTDDIKRAVERMTGLPFADIADVQDIIHEIDIEFSLKRTDKMVAPAQPALSSGSPPESVSSLVPAQEQMKGLMLAQQKRRAAAIKQQGLVQLIQPLVREGLAVEGWQDLSNTIVISPEKTEKEPSPFPGLIPVGDHRKRTITLGDHRAHVETPDLEFDTQFPSWPAEPNTMLSSIRVRRDELIAPDICINYYDNEHNDISLRNSDAADEGARPDFMDFNRSVRLGSWARYDFSGQLMSVNVQFGQKPERFHVRFTVHDSSVSPTREMTAEEVSLWSESKAEMWIESGALHVRHLTEKHTYPLKISLPDLAEQIRQKIQSIQSF